MENSRSKRPTHPAQGDMSDIRRVLGEDDGQASNKMKVDVTVEEPRPGVVGLQRQRFVSSYDRRTGEDAERTYHEADRDVVSRKANVDRVPPDGVHIVVLGGACTASHGEGMIGWRKGCVSAPRHAGQGTLLDLLPPPPPTFPRSIPTWRRRGNEVLAVLRRQLTI